MTTRSEDGKKETDESFQDIWTRNGSRERCNEHPYFEDLNGSGKIPKPISLIRQKFPRLRAKRERERERGALDKRQSSTGRSGVHSQENESRCIMLSTPKSSIFIYSRKIPLVRRISAIFFFFILSSSSSSFPPLTRFRSKG